MGPLPGRALVLPSRRTRTQLQSVSWVDAHAPGLKPREEKLLCFLLDHSTHEDRWPLQEFKLVLTPSTFQRSDLAGTRLIHHCRTTLQRLAIDMTVFVLALDARQSHWPIQPANYPMASRIDDCVHLTSLHVTFPRLSSSQGGRTTPTPTSRGLPCIDGRDRGIRSTLHPACNVRVRVHYRTDVWPPGVGSARVGHRLARSGRCPDAAPRFILCTDISCPTRI
ncbi:hypothetical protein LXA43DRAFT_737789 [Ganoderma leucocontextum]|nr:hypothetical protein LXA43DRAFT_737789 [Ganoderma leucocontextum]